ncbi:MAG: YbaY family lipoprotein [Chlorobium sp.]|uniref:YbaY family lipoprotein n=1 Tax=Chlorobium sp. TaxID=1095 RepID=UPI002F422B45
MNIIGSIDTSGRGKRCIGIGIHQAIVASMLVLAGLLCFGSSRAGTLKGTAVYRERILLPPGAVFEVELQDISRAGAPAVVLGRYTRDPAGHPPFRFEIAYDDAAVHPFGRYSVRAAVRHEGRLLFTTDRIYRVLDGSGKPLKLLLVSAGAKATVVRVQGGEKPAVVLGEGS